MTTDQRAHRCPGAQAAGANSAKWNGRTTGGAWAGAGRYLLRVTATDGAGASHAGPAAGFSATALDRWGIAADLAAPTASGSPARGAQMVPAKQRLRCSSRSRSAASPRRESSFAWRASRSPRRSRQAVTQERHRHPSRPAAGRHHDRRLAVARSPGCRRQRPGERWMEVQGRARHRLRPVAQRPHDGRLTSWVHGGRRRRPSRIEAHLAKQLEGCLGRSARHAAQPARAAGSCSRRGR